jgi:polyhydroxyalkanoate synthesis regulator phasin
MNLDDLMGCKHAWAGQRAAAAMHINASFRSGELSKDEAVELLNDLINTDKLDKEATDFSVRTQLVTAITNLISVISLATSIPGF